MEVSPRQQQHRVRKRAPNACVRCRQQKIKCSGSCPCEQCKKRSLACHFDDAQQKILVTKGYISELQRQASVAVSAPRSHRNTLPTPTNSSTATYDATLGTISEQAHVPTPPLNSFDDQHEGELHSDTDLDPEVGSTEPEQDLTNPLVSSNVRYTSDITGRPYYLGTSSNWAFARRVLGMAHEVVYQERLPAPGLYPPYSAYDLGWNGRRTSVAHEDVALPTADFALFLINAVKFHCGQLYHVFDEAYFMQHFRAFHAGMDDADGCSELWYVHYLLILAFGKAFIVRTGKGRTPPGADLYVQAMKLLPDITFLCMDPVQSIEILCCAALYLQCIDLRNPAYNLIGQAMRLALEQGMHVGVESHHEDDGSIERRREAWWTVYMLDRHMSSLMGSPVALADEEIGARLPTFSGSAQKSLALEMQVKLSRVTAVVLQTVYGIDGRMDRRFMLSMKEALRTLANINDERNRSFPLDLKMAVNGISRLSAYLHLFHHQCIILTIRPLLFTYWQKRLEASRALRVGSKGGCRSLLRICVQSALHTIDILEALHAQSLLESFLPFDLENTFSSALVLIITSAVDPSLIRKNTNWLQTAYMVLEEMASRGNLVANLRRSELEQMETNLQRLPSAVSSQQTSAAGESQNISQLAVEEAMRMEGPLLNTDGPSDLDTLGDWNSEDPLSGDQLMAVADSLDFTDLDWLSAGLAEATNNAF